MGPGAAAGLRALPEHAGLRLGRRWPSRTWFISDGIHYTSPGYAVRSHDIAQALAQAFPAAPPVNLHQATVEREQDGSGAATPSCLVH